MESNSGQRIRRSDCADSHRSVWLLAARIIILGPVVQSVVSLTSPLRVISLTVFSGFNIQYSDIFC